MVMHLLGRDDDDWYTYGNSLKIYSGWIHIFCSVGIQANLVNSESNVNGSGMLIPGVIAITKNFLLFFQILNSK